jgi:cytochrome c oxidase subunit II
MLGMVLVSLVATVVGTAISLWIDWFPPQASTAAKDIDRLWDVLMIASVPIFVLVMAVAIYSVLIFRAEPGDLSDGAPIHGNTKLEIVWVTIPFILVSALAAYGWVVLDDIEEKQPNAMVVNVTGQQFAWRFDYPGEGKVKSNQLVLAKDRPVEFRVRTEDVLHDFWVPEFRLKTDAVPGLTTKIRVTPNRLGEYEVVCAELCGLGHATMRQNVRVVSEKEFGEWVASEQDKEGGGAGGGGAGGAGGGGAGGAGDDQAAGKEVFTGDGGCAACHTLADAGSESAIGPGLDELTADARKFGRQEGQSPEEYVRTAIVDPDAFLVPDYNKGVMPTDFEGRLSPAEIDALVKYLLSVSGGGE